MAVVWALVVRDVRRALHNPVGYVFVTLFVLLSAVAAFWPEAFYHDNLATLDQLNRRFLPLLVFFIPALAMNTWAEEKRYGTDALLLTLPASEWALVLGKYLATLSTYSIALALSLSHVGVLRWLGHPDLGLIGGNFVGYWLFAAALIPLAMLGSQLSANAAVAFVLGTMLCAVPVFLHMVPAILPAATAVVGVVAMASHADPFYRGAVSPGALVYWPAATCCGLFVNVVLMSRRRWPSSTEGRIKAMHAVMQSASAAVALAMVVVLASRASGAIDLTTERIHSLSPSIRQFVAAETENRRIRVQAFISPDVPEDYVQQRRQLLNVLYAMATASRDGVELSIDDTEQYSDAARHARERFGIVPRLVADVAAPGGDQRAVFLGVAFTAGDQEDVIPFLEKGLSPEYEVARSIRLVTGQTRKRVGLIDPDTNLLGGMDYQTGRSRLPWIITREMARQYEVVAVDASRPIARRVADAAQPTAGAGVDALVVILPARLLQVELDNTLAAIKAGVPALLILDPAPAMDMRLAPAASMAARLNPYLGAGQAISYKNTGDIQKALGDIGIRWPPTQIVWDGYRPRQEFAPLPWEIVFIGRGAGNGSAFADDDLTRGLQDIVLSYPGSMSTTGEAGVVFQPLLSTGSLSGSVGYFDVLQPSPSGPVLNRDVAHEPGDHPLTVAARVRRQHAGQQTDVVAVADLDFISNQFFAMREATPSPAFDNVAFFMNALDVLLGERSWLALRTPRSTLRTLERLERETRDFMERRASEEQAAKADADRALQQANSALQESVRGIQERTDLDQQSKDVMVRSFEQTEQRKLEILKANIEQARLGRIVASREATEHGVRQVQLLIRSGAVVAPILPILVVGLVTYRRRRTRQLRRSIVTGRVARS